MLNRNPRRKGLLVVLSMCCLSIVFLAQVPPPGCLPLCRIDCRGSATKSTIAYSPTALHLGTGEIFGNGDPIVPVETVQSKHKAALEAYDQSLAKGLNCQGEALLPKIELGFPTPGSAFVMNAGPTILAHARPTAMLSGGITDLNFVQTLDPKGGAVTAHRDAELTHKLESLEVGAEVISAAGVYVLMTGDSAEVVLMSRGDQGTIGVLQGIINQIVSVLIKKFPFFEESRVRFLTTKIIKVQQLLFEGTARYGADVTLDTPAVKAQGSSATNTFFKGLIDPGGSARHLVLNPGEPHTFKAFAQNQPKISIVLKTNGDTTAKATGFGGDAIAVAGNLWAYFSLMCCSKPGMDPRRAFSFFTDSAFYNADDTRTNSVFEKSKILKAFNDFKSSFKDKFFKGTGEANKLLAQGNCAGAKARLVELDAQLSELVDSAEKELKGLAKPRELTE